MIPNSEQKIFIDGIFTKIKKNNIEYLFNVEGGKHRIEVTDNDWVSKDVMNNNKKCILVRAGLGRGKTQASTDYK